ncbi:MAG: hypothetical protein EXR65_06080 [Dehalococcoidia bacterium]|nr:hypothetical protein [Dehalococcoidia bacterium]
MAGDAPQRALPPAGGVTRGAIVPARTRVLRCRRAGWLPRGARQGCSQVWFRLHTFGPAQMVLAVALLLLGLFCYATVQTASQSYRLRLHERAVYDEVQELQAQRAELQGLLTYLKSDEYIEAFARQQFRLVRPGETLVEVTAPAAPPAARQPGEKWWEVLFGTRQNEVAVAR